MGRNDPTHTPAGEPMPTTTKRPAKAHKEIVREAGIGRVSFVSIFAGVMCAYGTFALIAAIVGSVLDQLDVTTNFRSNDWTSSGAVAGLISALVLLSAYFFGGYVAGRMA